MSGEGTAMRMLQVAGLVAALGLCAAVAADGQSAKDWPTFRGNPAQTGVAGSSLPRQLDLLWTYEAGSAVGSTAAIVKGTVYVGNDDGKLLALDLDKGTLKWSYGAEGAITAAPAVRGGRVFVGDGEGVFHAVATATGSRLWTFTTEAEIISSANFHGEHVLVGSYDSHLYCFEAKTGRLLWKFETEAQVHCSPCIAGDQAIIAGCDGQLRMISLADGRQVGSVNIEANVAASPAFAGGLLYFATFRGRMLSVDPVLKRVLWSVEDPQGGDPFYASSAVSGERVIFAGRDRLVRCLGVKDGKEVWRFAARGDVDSSPVIVGSRVFFGSDDGTLYAVGLSDGRRLWSFDAGGPITASPAVAEGRLVIGTQDGAIYCFGEKRPPSGPRPCGVQRGCTRAFTDGSIPGIIGMPRSEARSPYGSNGQVRGFPSGG